MNFAYAFQRTIIYCRTMFAIFAFLVYTHMYVHMYCVLRNIINTYRSTENTQNGRDTMHVYVVHAL